MGGLISAAIYLGIGAMFHAIFVGAQFDFQNAWTWGWLLGWPIMLFATFWVVILALFIVFLTFLGIMKLAGYEL